MVSRSHLKRTRDFICVRFQISIALVLVETGQWPGADTDEVHSSLHSLRQTQRDQETTGLGGEPGEAPSGVSGSAGKHPRTQSWLCLPSHLQEVLAEVSLETLNHGVGFWQTFIYFLVNKACYTQICHPDQGDVATVAWRWKTGRSAPTEVSQHGCRPVPTGQEQDLH